MVGDGGSLLQCWRVQVGAQRPMSRRNALLRQVYDQVAGYVAGGTVPVAGGGSAAGHDCACRPLLQLGLECCAGLCLVPGQARQQPMFSMCSSQQTNQLARVTALQAGLLPTPRHRLALLAEYSAARLP
jgi:hypothetical protein